jgi:RecA-family ATPase
VFDTLASSMAGGDENGPDMQVAVDAARRISRKTGAAVLLVHHTGRDESRQKAERGHTSLRGAADVMFRVTAEDGALKLDNDKARDSKLLDQLLLRLLPVAGSCVVQPNTAGLISTDLTKPERAALEALAAVTQEDGATATEWLASSQLPNGSFYRARRRLIDLGLVRRELKAKRYFLTAKGLVSALPTPN